MDKYLINFFLQIRNLMPIRKRKNTRSNFLFRGMKWIRNIHDEFIQWGPGIRQIALVNNQVINFRDYLRTRFGSEQIDITHTIISPTLLGRGDDTQFTLGRGEDETSWIGRAIDSTLTGISFVVSVPNGLEYDEDELRAVIDFYKVPGSNYIIQEV